MCWVKSCFRARNEEALLCFFFFSFKHDKCGVDAGHCCLRLKFDYFVWCFHLVLFLVWESWKLHVLLRTVLSSSFQLFFVGRCLEWEDPCSQIEQREEAPLFDRNTALLKCKPVILYYSVVKEEALFLSRAVKPLISYYSVVEVPFVYPEVQFWWNVSVFYLNLALGP